MGLTRDQQIPDKKNEEKSEWSFRRLFPFAGAMTSISKVFVNPFDILLGYLVVILSIAEVLGRHVSWFLWLLTTLIFFADLVERKTGMTIETKEKDGKPIAK